MFDFLALIFGILVIMALLTIGKRLSYIVYRLGEISQTLDKGEDTQEQIQKTLVDIRESVESQEQIQKTLIDIRENLKSQETTLSFYRL